MIIGAAPTFEFLWMFYAKLAFLFSRFEDLYSVLPSALHGT